MSMFTLCGNREQGTGTGNRNRGIGTEEAEVVFFHSHHRIVISTEGVAEVEKPAVKNATTDLTERATD